MNNEEKIEIAFDTLRKGVIDLIKNPDKLEETMKHYGNNVSYNRYSPFNTMLLMFDTAFRKQKMYQMARGYKQWEKEFGRKVKKGEKAMWILAPNKVKIVEKDEETSEETIKYVTRGFRSVPVFELSQTEGEPVPQPTKNHEYKSLNDLDINEFIGSCGVSVEWEELIGCNGYTDGKKIVIGKHNNELAAICTLFHELCHYHLHFNRDGEEVKLYNDDSTNLKELEAEAVSYMVSSALGIENGYSRKYIANWNKGNGSVDVEFENRCDKLLQEALNLIDLFAPCIRYD